MGDGHLIKPLHGLRGLAALTVVTFHLAPLHFKGAIGVTLFFVLSGFLMGRLYLTREFDAVQVWRYATARFARIYPLFALVLLLALALNTQFGFTIFWIERWEIDRHLLLLGDAHTVWTIAVECHFYALFLAFWLAFARGWLGLRGLVALVLPLAMAAHFFDGRIELLRYLHIFVLGMIISRMADAPSPMLARLAPLGLPLALALFAAAAIYRLDVYANPFVVLVTGAIVLFAVVAPASPFAHLLSLPPLVWIGEISFGLYLLHRFSEQFVWRVLGTTAKTWWSFGLGLGTTILMATLVFHFYEDPLRRRIRSLAHKLEQSWRGRRATV